MILQKQNKQLQKNMNKETKQLQLSDLTKNIDYVYTFTLKKIYATA
jgi:hypothetical protein